MPYSSISELPKHIKKYSPKIQRMWMYTWNSTYKKTEDEGKSFRAANSTIKRRVEQNGANRYGYDTSFRILIDKHFGNLDG